jgi:peroxiredoxin
MRQLVQLQEALPAFEEADIGVVAMTYDSPEHQKQFIDRFGITIPLLSDVDAATFQILGILNTDYAPDHSSYGIPWPGIFVIDRDMTIVGKVFVDEYDTRVDASGVLTYAQRVLGP